MGWTVEGEGEGEEGAGGVWSAVGEVGEVVCWREGVGGADGAREEGEEKGEAVGCHCEDYWKFGDSGLEVGIG